MNRADFITAMPETLQETPFLYYVSGHKYQARNAMIYQTFVYPERDIYTDLIVLRTDGWMWVSPYFAWDGCSGPTWDDSTNMRAGQCHDALYALHRMGLLPLTWRPQSDRCLPRLMLADGAWPVRARYYEKAVNILGEKPATEQRKIHIAPRRDQK